MAQTAAELLIERLNAWGVDTIFGFAGDGVGEILEVLRRNPKRMRFIDTRHEEAAAFAACGYAKFTGKLGVCMATSGPGGVHLANGLYDAQGDNQPVLAITGHTWSHFIGTHYQQDVPLERLFADVSAYSERVMNADHLPRVLDRAIKAALSQHTVAHINIPRDVQKMQPSREDHSGRVPGLFYDLTAPRRPLPSQEVLKQAADLINAGKRVAIISGRGAIAASDDVIALAEAVAGPIIKPLLGKPSIPDDSPYTTGGLGYLGTAPSIDALRECDVLIIAGSTFPYIDFYPKPDQAKVVQIDRDPTHIGIRVQADVGLVGDMSDVLGALLPLIKKKSDRSFLTKAQERMGHWNRLMEQRGTNLASPMKPQVVFHELNKVLADDALITCDAGTDTTWIARHVHMKPSMQFWLSGTLSTMACALPYSVGAAIGHPGKQVVCVAGDGAFTMLMGELATLVRYDLPVKIILVKNNALNQVRWEQLVQFGYPEFAVDLQPIDFAGVARACGLKAYTLDDASKAADVLKAAFAEKGPTLVECVVDPNEPPLPGKITTEDAIGIAEALLKRQPNRFGIMREAVIATAKTLRLDHEVMF